MGMGVGLGWNFRTSLLTPLSPSSLLRRGAGSGGRIRRKCRTPLTLRRDGTDPQTAFEVSALPDGQSGTQMRIVYDFATVTGLGADIARATEALRTQLNATAARVFTADMEARGYTALQGGKTGLEDDREGARCLNN